VPGILSERAGNCVFPNMKHLILSLASLLVLHPAISAGQGRTNFVFILIDDFGYADSGPYGVKDIRTPNMDRLAREWVKFTDFYANAPVCTPTRCGFITGRWQQRTGLEWAMGFSAEAFRRQDDAWVPEKDYRSLGLPATLPEMLFDLSNDHGERRDVSLRHPDVLAPLKRKLAEWETEMAKEHPDILVK